MSADPEALRSSREESPLLSPEDSSAHHIMHDPEVQSQTLDGASDHEEETKSSLYLFLLVLSLGGLQIVWSVELSNGSPYLLSLGMSKSLLAIVWIAGPVTGVLVQPYIGIRSDNCRISWGKRKPFMLGGGAATILALLALAWAREIVGSFLVVLGAAPNSQGVKTATIVFAIVFMYILDFAINTVQAAIRAFIVDNAPTHQQESANAWASRITGIGSILGYISSYMDLPRALPYFGNTQFKVLCVLASIALSTTTLVSCLYITERDPRLEGLPINDRFGFLPFVSQVFRSIRRLPPQIRRICEVQFFNWIGWFPFLFYVTTYIGQLYVNPILESHPHGELSDHDIDIIWEQATRVGAFALLIFAFTSFTSNTLLPFLIIPTFQPQPSVPFKDSRPGTAESAISGLSRSSSTAGLAMSMSAELYPDRSRLSTSSRLSRYMAYIQIPGLTLRRAWLFAHILFVGCMFSTFFIQTPLGATIMTGVVGISWSLTVWAPFALIGAEISRRETLRRQRRRESLSGATTPTMDNESNEVTVIEDNNEDVAMDQAGVILGLHNVAISSPQILATLLSSAIFRALQKERGTPGDDSVGWVLRLCGLATIVAIWFTMRLDEGVVGAL